MIIDLIWLLLKINILFGQRILNVLKTAFYTILWIKSFFNSYLIFGFKKSNRWTKMVNCNKLYILRLFKIRQE